VTIPNSVVRIGDRAFDSCSSLGAITVGASNSAYRSLDGVLFDRGQATVIRCPQRKAGSYIVPDGVTSIGDYAFATCTNLTSVVLGNGVANIGKFAFYSCSSLTNIPLPESITSIPSLAFARCTSLPSVTIPDTVTCIGDYAFELCANLMNATIGNGVTSIGDEAFGGCPNLCRISLGYGVAVIGGYAFYACTNLTGVLMQGNAPSLEDSYAFYGADNAIVYYLPGTAGWGPMLGGRPTALWNPQVQMDDGSFGPRTNEFGFTIMGTTNIPIVVAGCTNVTSPVWLPLQVCSLTNGSVYFSDPQWTNYPARFYRIGWP
jgi:hypothetical protein